MKKNIAVIILAAGKSTRMKSVLPKVLHPLCGRPMLGYVLDLVRDLKIKTAVAVLGYKHKEVKKILPKGIKIALQKEMLGTADAVKATLPLLRNFKGTILVLYGDIPLLKKESINRLLKYHSENNCAATLLVAQVAKPAGYGRILRDKYSTICGIAEEKDASAVQKELKEINTGIICFSKEKLMQGLKAVRPDNRKKEYYLTDVISIFYKKGYLVEALKLEDINESLGINSRADLARANSIMQRRLNEKFMQEGVTIIDPQSTFISYGSRIGRDSVIYPFTVIEKSVKIGRHCEVGPFAHLREGTELADNVVAGNFLEIVRSKISPKTLLKHFCYIGDSRIGRAVNIGAGTITANFDKGKKNTTVIKNGAAIGSDSVLVAPVRIGKKAITGAGCVVVKNTNVLDGTTVVGVPAKRLKTKN